jgi:hypothetical protein
MRKQMNYDSFYREAVKNVVLLKRDAQQPANEYTAFQQPEQPSLVKFMFNYLRQSTPRASSDVENNYDKTD